MIPSGSRTRALRAGYCHTSVMVGGESPFAESTDGGSARAHNLPASVSLASGITACVFALVHTSIRVDGVPIRYIAVPALGFVATAFGAAGLAIAKRSDGDRVTAGWGLGLGICILVLTTFIGVFALFLSGLPDNGF